ncbi:pilus assembly protein CpaE [Kribbella sp. NPDC055071]
MITIEQAGRLRKAGVLWVPAAGDRFVVPGRDMDDDVFVVSDMTVEVHDYQGSKVIGFNGTTEWALDSIEQREVIWLPREEQLRAILGDRFVSLEAVPGGYRVNLTDSTHPADDAEQAYAAAVIHVLGA